MLKLLINKIDIENKYLGIIEISKLITLDIEIPNIQRIKDDIKVREIIKYQLDYFKNNKKFNFIGVINIHYCEENKKYYLIDGQHRFEALKKLYNEMGHNLQISIELIIIKTLSELKENYHLINKNTPLPEFPATIDKSIPEKTSLYFKEKYPNIWSKTSRARRPHIYFNFFQEVLGFLTDKLNITSSIELQKIIEDYNLKLSKWKKDQFPEPKSINDNMIKKCKDNNFYLDYLNIFLMNMVINGFNQ